MEISPTAQAIRFELARERSYVAAARIAALAGIERSPEVPSTASEPKTSGLLEQELVADVLEALVRLLDDFDGDRLPGQREGLRARLHLPRRPLAEQEPRC